MKEKIALLLEECLQFNANDLLVHIDGKNTLAFDNLSDLTPDAVKSILKKAQETERESGVNPLCISKGSIEWELKSKQTVLSPLFLQSCSVKLNRVTNSLTFEVDENSFINPFVLSQLKSEFDIKFEGDTIDFVSFLEAKGFSELDVESSFLGNFHPHRYEQIRELESLLELEESPLLAELLEGERVDHPITLNLSNQQLFPADTDQRLVFEAFKKMNVVVQGPPGTGKSQVLTNLLSKLVYGNYSTVLVSEKRVALEVIQSKFKEFDISHLCYVADANASSKDFIAELKDSWNFLEKQEVAYDKNLLLSEQLLARVQMQLDLLRDEKLFGGIGYHQFSLRLQNRNLDKITYRSDLPALSELLQFETSVKNIFAKNIHQEFASIKQIHFKNGTIKELDLVLKELLSELKTLKNYFSITDFSSLEEAMKVSALCQLFGTESYQQHAALFGEKERIKFFKVYDQWQAFQNEKAQQNLALVAWKKEPSLTEVELMEKQLADTSFWSKRKFKKLWQNYSSFSEDEAEKILINRKNQLNNIEKELKLEAKLLAMSAPIETSDLQVLYHHLKQNSFESLQEFEKIPKNIRTKMAREGLRLNVFYNKLKLYFSFDTQLDLEAQLDGILQKHDLILLSSSAMMEASSTLIKSLGFCSSFEDLELHCLKSARLEFNLQFPQHADLHPSNLLVESAKISDLLNEEAQIFARTIKQKQKETFESFHELMRTPSTKLSTSQREKKAQLRKGKAILVKEFAKTRSFPTLRELFASDARLWIQVLKPVYLCNPTQMARCFPLEKEVFDVAIFDEASQITLQNALGTIYRAKRVLLAGDRQQMGPSSYFKVLKNEVMDVLHQGSYYWLNLALHHHYRSEHPALIAFSNQHFYENQLLTFPSAEVVDSPINFHFVENGLFFDRRNNEEAKAVAKKLKHLIDRKEKLGIVSFSEAQLDEIFQQLDENLRNKLLERIDEGTAFFKALENVQGDECDHLIISLGYGKDHEGDFHYRFGPLNGKNGGKRLNVLLTRARKQIDFFASIRSSDFDITQNENVELLRKYLFFIEQGKFEESSKFPFQLSPKINGKQLSFAGVQNQIKNAEELITLVTILQHRKWELSFS